MKNVLANVFAWLGGAGTALCGILFVGLILSVAMDPTLASGPDRSLFVDPLIWTGIFTALGALMLSSGLRLMRHQ